MKIRFVKPWVVKQGDGKGPKYEVGQVVEFKGQVAETYARKYITRGLAVDVANDPKPEPAAERPQHSDVGLRSVTGVTAAARSEPGNVGTRR